MFDVIFHADWSIRKTKRWLAMAERRKSGWEISSLKTAPPGLAQMLLATARNKRVLAGFDFPIGVPAKWARAMALKSFPDFLKQLRENKYPAFFDAASSASEISLERPFYPASAKAGVKQEHLYKALGFEAFDDLRRRCEGPTQNRVAACPLFWTLGANQVGKGALSGWREVIIPCVEEKARLWPFDGDLDFESPNGLTITETYPAETYGWLGINFQGKGGKKSQAKRREFIPTILGWLEARNISLSEDANAQLRDGFGAAADGEDRFDTFCGACGMIEIVNGCRAADAPDNLDIRDFEGWILGQKAE
jgi:hypothetical protein